MSGKYKNILLTVLFLMMMCLICMIYSQPLREDFIPVNVLTDYKILKQNHELFKKVLKILDENNIEYWIIGGTLLGAVRDKTMCPWDDDIDIAINESTLSTLLNLRNKFEVAGLEMSGIFFGQKIYSKNGKILPGKNFKYPFIDVFVMKLNNDGKYIYVSDLANKYWPNDPVSKDDLYPLKKYDFEDYQVYGMQNPIQYLEKMYPGWKKIGKKTTAHDSDNTIPNQEFGLVYDSDKKPYLWLYWDTPDGQTDPVYIDMCYDTVINKCNKSFEIIRLNKYNIQKWLPELEEYGKYISGLRIAHKVDFYRILLLYKYGGMYIDSDVVVLRDPIEIMNKLKKYEFVGFGCTGNNCTYGYKNPSNWILASRPNSILMGNVLMKLIGKIKQMYEVDNYNLDYHDVGKLVIWKEIDNLIQGHDYEYYHYPNKFDGTRDKHGNWIYNTTAFSNTPIEYEDEENMFFFVLYNSEITDNIKKMTKEEMMKQNWNFTKFIKKSMS